MIRSARLILPVLLPLLLLAACQGEERADDGRRAGGEILPGSASDAMLPYDTVRSQPPLAPRTDASGAPSDAASSPASEAPAAEVSATPAAGPAAEITPSAE